MATLVLVDVWEWTPLMALILLAGLKALPLDVIEAAVADGATALQRFRLIILPLLLPAVFPGAGASHDGRVSGLRLDLCDDRRRTGRRGPIR